SQGDVRSLLIDPIGAALSPGHHPLQDGAGSGEHLGHHQLGGVHAEVVLGIGTGGLQELHQRLGSGLGGLHQDRHGGAGVLAADQITHDLDLA
ncbi:S-layer-like y domain-containing protein, partial [Dysosmobacter welbionis]